MVASAVVNQICGDLISDPEKPEALERLAAFLNVIGPSFDHENWQHHPKFCETFMRVKDLSTQDSVPLRVRCILRDVLDLRSAHWQDERVVTKKDEGPMTLDQVHQKAKEDERENLLRSTPKGSSGSMSWSQPQNRGAPRSSGQRDSTGSWEQQGQRNSTGSWKQQGQSANNRGRDRASASPDGQSGSQPVSRQSSQQGSPRDVRHPQPSKLVPSPRDDAPNLDKPPPRKGPLNLDKLRKGLHAIVKELCQSHDDEEAIRRVKEMNIPVEHQAGEFSHILQQSAEEAKEEVRAVCFRFAVQLLVKKVFASSELMEGLRKLFTESYEELRLDQPKLPSIVRDELKPALCELVQADMLTEDALEELTRHI